MLFSVILSWGTRCMCQRLDFHPWRTAPCGVFQSYICICHAVLNKFIFFSQEYYYCFNNKTFVSIKTINFYFVNDLHTWFNRVLSVWHTHLFTLNSLFFSHLMEWRVHHTLTLIFRYWKRLIVCVTNYYLNHQFL